MSSYVFLVCKTIAETPNGNVMEVMGAFLSESEAVANCRLDEWIGPLQIGARMTDAPEDWPGAYYPNK